MFESIQPARRRRHGLGFVLSIAAHAAALAALVATAFWQVDKLEVQDAPLLVAGGPGAPLSAGDAAAEPERPAKKKPRRARDLTQVDRSKPAEPDGDTGETGQDSGEADGDRPAGDGLGTGLFSCGEGADCSVLERAGQPACGDRRVEAGEECDDGNRAAGDGCDPGCRREAERVVVSRLLEGSRVAGNPQITPPDSVRQAMARSGAERATGAVKMCLDTRGQVRSLQLLRSTGHPDYDRKLLDGMRGWRYVPYRLASGAAVPVCTVITFIYRLQ